MFDTRLQYILKSLCLVLLIETWGCSQAAKISQYRYESFTLATGNKKDQPPTALEELVAESIKDKLIKKGYVYREYGKISDMKVVARCKTKLEKNHYIKLDVNLDIYESYTYKTIWSVSASNLVRSQNIAAEIIDPVVRQLTLKIPYANRIGGIGVVIGRDLKIRDFSPTSPAKKAGLKVNDLIVKVDKKAITELNGCQELLKGEVGTPVELCVERGGQELNFTVNRISINRMSQRNNPLKKIRRRSLKEDFRRRVLQQP